MGIDTQVRDPVQREPVVFFCDPRYASGESDGGTDSPRPAESSMSIPPIVIGRLLPGQGGVPSGTSVFILSLEPGIATLWVTNPTPRPIGQVVGSETQEIAHACRTGVKGLVGMVVSDVTEGHGDEFRVQIYAA